MELPPLWEGLTGAASQGSFTGRSTDEVLRATLYLEMLRKFGMRVSSTFLTSAAHAALPCGLRTWRRHGKGVQAESQIDHVALSASI